MAYAAFPTGKKVGDRPWGSEELLVLIPGILTLKRLILTKGSKGGLQYHREKNECGTLISGKLLVRYEDESGNLVEKVCLPGESFHFPPGAIHQEEALEECVIIEASNPVFNDRVRVEEVFGLGPVNGLPTTTKDEIKKL